MPRPEATASRARIEAAFACKEAGGFCGKARRAELQAAVFQFRNSAGPPRRKHSSCLWFDTPVNAGAQLHFSHYPLAGFGPPIMVKSVSGISAGGEALSMMQRNDPASEIRLSAASALIPPLL